MKYFLAFVFAGLVSTVSLAQLNVWRWQNPSITGNPLYSVQMLSSDITYACGAGGVFIKTSDGGRSWEGQSNILKNTRTLLSLNFLNTNFGMCCGDAGLLLKTRDGGTSWQQLSADAPGTYTSLVVVDTNIALVVTDHGGIMKSIDGGATWSTIPIEGNYPLYNIRKVRSNFLVISGYSGVILNSVDTGKTWKKLEYPYGNTVRGCYFMNDVSSIAVGDQGLLTRTTNDGSTWADEEMPIYPLTVGLNDIDGKDPNIFAAVGNHGIIVYTTDAGADWQYCQTFVTKDFHGVSFLDKLNAIAVGNGLIMKTTDGGQTWNAIPHLPYTAGLRSVAFPKGDTSNGLAVGNGVILRTTNGGADWLSIPLGWNHLLRSVAFMDSKSAIAVGEYGMILKTTDLGITWSRQPSETNQNLYSVSFASAKDGLVAGDSNTILRTYTAGQFWTNEFTGPGYGITDYFNSVSYPDPLHAFMTGFHGYYISSDGGVNWRYTSQDTSVYEDYVYYGVSFIDNLHGAMILNNHGLSEVEFTSDGGDSWFSSYSLLSAPLSVQYVDIRHVTVTGARFFTPGGFAGYIGHTTDGGLTWQDQTSGAGTDLYGVCFGTLEAGTVVGDGGTILRMTTNEHTNAVRPQGASGMPQITLDANYPNPFSVSTTISYILPTSGLTTVEIYSIDGKLVASLASDFESAGEHSIHFSPSGLASGTYICRVTLADMSAAERLVIRN